MGSTPPSTGYFCSLELEKLALNPLVGAALTSGAVGGLLGGGAGYIGSKLRGEEDSGRSALKGALIGAGGGALLGGGLSAVSPTVSGALNRFGARQAHTFTGWVPHEARGASPSAQANYEKYVKDIGAVSPHVATKEEDFRIPFLKKWRAERSASRAEAMNKNQDALLKARATSLPGFVKSLWGPERGNVLRASASDIWHGTGPFGKAMLGMGVYDTAKAVGGSPDPAHPDEGRAERAGRAIGNTAGWLLPGTIPVAGNIVGGEVLGRGLGAVGKGVDYLTGSKPKVAPPPRMIHDPTDPVASTDRLGGPQVMMSQSAQGKPFGGGME